MEIEERNEKKRKEREKKIKEERERDKQNTLYTKRYCEENLNLKTSKIVYFARNRRPKTI